MRERDNLARLIIRTTAAAALLTGCDGCPPADDEIEINVIAMTTGADTCFDAICEIMTDGVWRMAGVQPRHCMTRRSTKTLLAYPRLGGLINNARCRVENKTNPVASVDVVALWTDGRITSTYIDDPGAEVTP